MFQTNSDQLFIPYGSEEVDFVVFANFSNTAILDIRLDPILPFRDP